AAGVEALARRLLEAPEVRPVGLGARDTLRLEAGLCLYGQDIDVHTTPGEAGLGWTVAKARRNGAARRGGFPGEAIILEQLENGTARRRIGIRSQGRALVRAGAELTDADGRPIGRVTSGGFAPSLDHPVAMAYLERERAHAGTTVYAVVRGRRLAAAVVGLPFVPHHCPSVEKQVRLRT
ncbi:MAG: glycine cleavage T C-terminal barrel domain-containing protein, partial [Planctomycetaceae bacterium]